MVSEPPPGWPQDVEYLSEHCVASPSLSATQTAVFCQPLRPDSPFSVQQARSGAYTCIKRINAPQHPACGQFGLFAKRDIPPRTIIVPYLGEVHTEGESDPNSEYDLRVWGVKEETGLRAEPVSPSEVPLGIDATKRANEARFVNDYRGIYERANVFFEDFSVSAKNGPGIQRGLVFKSGSKAIRQGQELVTSYGKGFWAARKACKIASGDNNASGGIDDESGLSEPNQQSPVENSHHVPRPPSTPNHVQLMLDRQRARLRALKNSQ